jgi:hypothetical protein
VPQIGLYSGRFPGFFLYSAVLFLSLAKPFPSGYKPGSAFEVVPDQQLHQAFQVQGYRSKPRHASGNSRCFTQQPLNELIDLYSVSICEINMFMI